MPREHICLWADTLSYPEGGGHLWVYLNWALGLQSLGHKVTWLEAVDPQLPSDKVRGFANALHERLNAYGLANTLALVSLDHSPLPRDIQDAYRTLEEAASADLLLSLCYLADDSIVSRFRRTALIDIDPGLLQVWLSQKQLQLARYDTYFTTGETVGQSHAKFPSAGIDWLYTPPCVALDAWPVTPAPPDAPFTTVSHWSSCNEWVVIGDDAYHNDKRSGFEPYFDLPRLTRQPLTLALCQAADESLQLAPDEAADRQQLIDRGWQVIHSHSVAATPWAYQRFIQSSRGEFSCAKPSCVRLQNAWISDRTLCYLASGRPAIVQDTGPSRLLPAAAGIFRFRTPRQAANHLEFVANDYDHQSRLARELAETHFDAAKVAASVLQRALT